MGVYKNAEGYPDPTAGDAVAAIIAKEKRRAKQLENIQMVEDYEYLCRTFKEKADELGFAFPGNVWLRHVASGRLFKHN